MKKKAKVKSQKGDISSKVTAVEKKKKISLSKIPRLH